MTAEQVLRLHSEGLNQALFLHIIDKERHVNHDVSQHRQTASVDRRSGVYENVAALFCIALHCTAFDCDGEVARTP